jgi:hypothetical protein
LLGGPSKALVAIGKHLKKTPGGPEQPQAATGDHHAIPVKKLCNP